MVGPAAKRAAVAHLQAVMDLSERRACRIVGADRKMIRHRSRRADEIELRSRLREFTNERRRFGYRRLFILLRREGEPSGINRIYRRYREDGLTVRRRRARRRAVGTRAPILLEAKRNARWSLDVVHDQLAGGRRCRVLNIVDDVTRERLAAIPDTSISGRRVSRELTGLISRRGKPGIIVADHRLSGGSRSDLRSRRGQEAAEGHRVHRERHPRLVEGPEGRPALHRPIEGQEVSIRPPKGTGPPGVDRHGTGTPYRRAKGPPRRRWLGCAGEIVVEP
jgi:transposase InsO family protein